MADLRDIRSAVSQEAHAALLAEERATGRTLADQVRTLVEAWAAQRIHASKVLTALLRSDERMPEVTGGERK